MRNSSPSVVYWAIDDHSFADSGLAVVESMVRSVQNESRAIVVDVRPSDKKPAWIKQGSWDAWRAARATTVGGIVVDSAPGHGCQDARLFSDFAVATVASQPCNTDEIAGRLIPGALVCLVPQVDSGGFQPSLSSGILAARLGLRLHVHLNRPATKADDLNENGESIISIVATAGLPVSGIAFALENGVDVVVGNFD